jgi:putative ATP-dependent endonuclease of OLD family
MAAEIRLGTSSFTAAGWSGAFYPPRMKQTDYLSFYSTRFDTVEVDSPNFRAIKNLEFFPGQHNVLLGPNNTGKTAVLEALNLLLNPEFTMRSTTIDENDFYGRIYKNEAPTEAETHDIESMESASDENLNSHANASAANESPTISIEAVLSGLTLEDEDLFRDYLVPWNCARREVLESTDEGTDSFHQATVAIRVAFEGQYDP